MSSGLLVVDVQPAYSEFCDSVVRQVASRINNTRKPTVIFWVGMGLTDDKEWEVRDYLHQNGTQPGKLANCKFVEKNYGFFRPWMDTGVSSEVMVSVGKEMLSQGLPSSEGMDLSCFFESEVEPISPLWAPPFSPDLLNWFDKVDVCGGGRHECLAEMEFYLDMKAKSYTRLDQLVYG